MYETLIQRVKKHRGGRFESDVLIYSTFVYGYLRDEYLGNSERFSRN